MFSRLLELIKTARSDTPSEQQAALSFKSSEHWLISECVDYFKSRDQAEKVAVFTEPAQKWDAYSDIVQTQLRHAEKTLSENDPEFADALFAAGNSLLFNEKYQDALALLQRALHSYQKIYGEKHESVVDALNRLCVVNRMLDNLADAEAAIRRALAIAEENFSDKDVYPRTLENFALLKAAQGESEEASRSYTRAVVETERIWGMPDPETAEMIYRQSGYLYSLESSPSPK